MSRETRLLLSTAFLAILALWVLARLRFPDQPAAPTPVQPLLTQLRATASFDDLAAELTQLRPRLEPLLTGRALRIRENVAVALLENAALATRTDVIGYDPASGLTVLRVPTLPVPPPVPWSVSDPTQPRYLIAADATAGLALQPVLIGSLVPASTALWPDRVWLVPVGTNLSRGSFVFTTDALLAGLVIDAGGRTAILPGAVLLQQAEKLIAAGVHPPGTLGLEVQALAPAVARATGAAEGVVVTWVDPDGPAAKLLVPGDVIEAVDGTVLSTREQWSARAARAPAGAAMALRVRRGDDVREVGLTAAPAHTPAGQTAALGLTLRSLPGTGSAVVEVEAGSAAERAGLQAGDLITLAGDTKAPSPAAVRRAFERVPAGGALLVAYARNGVHAVTAFEKP